MNVKLIFILTVLLIGAFSGSFQAISRPEFKTNDEKIQKSQDWSIVEITIPVDLIFFGYNPDLIDLSSFESSLFPSRLYEWIYWEWNESTYQYENRVDLKINIDWNIEFAAANDINEIDSFVNSNSWSAATSALNTTALNLQEEIGERQSIFTPQNGTAINGTALEEYLAQQDYFNSSQQAYSIYLLNFSRFDSGDGSQMHWFEIDEYDPDSKTKVDFWRLEWDNDLNPNVEFPYSAWGFRNRLFFIDPYCYQWYMRWTDIWWKPDNQENLKDYRTTDLASYLAGLTVGSPTYKSALITYLTDWINDVVWDTAGRGDGFWSNQRCISAQILMLNDATNHGYSKTDLEWIIHEEILQDALEYIVPPEIANISVQTTWAELSDISELQQIITDNTLGAAELGSYPWYRPDWTYLEGNSIFSAFHSLRQKYFNLTAADAIFTSWMLLMQNVSMVAFAYGDWHEFTALGGSGNVAFFKDLNRYYESDGITHSSGATAILAHEIGHVLGLGHAELYSQALEGGGGFMRDTMSYFVEGTPDFSIFTKDSLYRTSSIIAKAVTNDTINQLKITANETLKNAISDLLTAGDAAFESMDYVNAFLNYRQLYDLAACQEGTSECSSSITTYPSSSSTIATTTSSIPTTFPGIVFIFSLGAIALWYRKKKEMKL
ncbi:MAG: hypothetical protein ACFFBD_13105 [Candidatus Hodarchaeota archaeon]